MLKKIIPVHLLTGQNIVPTAAAHPADFMVVKGNELHRLITLLVMGFVLLYSSIGFLQGYLLPSAIILSLFPFTVTSYIVFKTGYTLASKLINLVSVSACIVLTTGCFGSTAFTQAFFIPVLASTLIVFQGKEKKLGLLLAALVFVLFISIVAIEYRIGNLYFTEEQLRTERIMNLTAASVVTLAEILVVLSLSNRIQDSLMEQTRSLNATIATRDKMMAILTHDLRSPLALICSALHNLTLELPENSTEKHILDELNSRAEATLVMVDNLLLWSRAQTNQIACRPKQVHYSDIRHMMQTFFELHRSKRIHVVFDIPENGAVLADRNLLQIVLRNLFSNAVKYSYENGTISLAINEQHHQAEIVLSDTGTGMDVSQVESILTGNSTSIPGTQNETGNGIGLQVVQEFLKKHHTQLAIHSTPGKGSVFSFTLPLEGN